VKPSGFTFSRHQKPPDSGKDAGGFWFVCCLAFGLSHRSDPAMQTGCGDGMETLLVSHPRDAIAIRDPDSVALETRDDIEAAG
jgi:hypothetical protein